MHKFPFQYSLPQCSLPCSLESKLGTIRYYIKVIIDVPYASSPQGIKYFTIIGPHIDCMEEKYLNALTAQDRKTTCRKCCRRGALAIRVTLERSAYLCGENIRLKAVVENRQEITVCVRAKLTQHIEYFIDKGVLGESKAISCTVLDHRSPSIAPNSRGKYDSALDQPIRLPVVPPTMIGVCRLIQIYYVLRINLEDEKGSESLAMELPLTVATLPYRIPNAAPPVVDYDFCSEHVEGGRYISPEFRLGQVYDGQGFENEDEVDDDVILYRPVYARIADKDRLKREANRDVTSVSKSCSTIDEVDSDYRALDVVTPEEIRIDKSHTIRSTSNRMKSSNETELNGSTANQNTTNNNVLSMETTKRSSNDSFNPSVSCDFPYISDNTHKIMRNSVIVSQITEEPSMPTTILNKCTEQKGK
ncbi:hypothetical protein AB6A40_005882 [Gnathostoma spinigerum]|uniref:Arrestin C-terminal-like domain-containing protein n=1 Tax=Gnathostoma spinigerum TaxID=75299 RepID=A0ABD6EGY1_9BILA